MSQSQRYFALFLGLLVSAAFLYLSVQKVELSKVVEEIQGASIGFLLLTQGSKLLGFIFGAARSSILLRPLHEFSFRSLMKSVFVAFVGNNIFPVRAGEILRAGYLAREGNLSPTSCLAVIFFERMLDTLSLLLLLICVLPLGLMQLPIHASFYLFGGALFATVSGAILISRDPNAWTARFLRFLRVFNGRLAEAIAPRVGRFIAGLGALSSPKAILGTVLLTFGSWAASIFTIQLWLWAFQINLPWYAPAITLLFISFGAALPSSPGNVGTYHYFAMLGIMAFGVAKTQAASIVLVGHALATVPFTVLGVLWLSSDILLSRQSTNGGSAWTKM